mmetsp:Transcript_12323/g.37982  ORF Transcript_12323/g.37982 Transcript_12323/m.37982 type:complete len:172 (-) Transcript_12323:799-1314(-)
MLRHKVVVPAARSTLLAVGSYDPRLFKTSSADCIRSKVNSCGSLLSDLIKSCLIDILRNPVTVTKTGMLVLASNSAVWCCCANKACCDDGDSVAAERAESRSLHIISSAARFTSLSHCAAKNVLRTLTSNNAVCGFSHNDILEAWHLENEASKLAHIAGAVGDSALCCARF